MTGDRKLKLVYFLCLFNDRIVTQCITTARWFQTEKV
jgi:hypothetical protein